MIPRSHLATIDQLPRSRTYPITDKLVRGAFLIVGKRACGLASRYDWTTIHRDYFRPAFFAAVRALLICFFQPKHWPQATGKRRDVITIDIDCPRGDTH